MLRRKDSLPSALAPCSTALRSGPDVRPPPKSLPFLARLLLLSRQRYHRHISRQICFSLARSLCSSFCARSISIVLGCNLVCRRRFLSCPAWRPAMPSWSKPSPAPLSASPPPLSQICSFQPCLPVICCRVSSRFSSSFFFFFSYSELSRPPLFPTPFPLASPSLALPVLSPVVCHEPTTLSTPPCLLPSFLVPLLPATSPFDLWNFLYTRCRLSPPDCTSLQLSSCFLPRRGILFFFSSLFPRSLFFFFFPPTLFCSPTHFHPSYCLAQLNHTITRSVSWTFRT